MKKKIFNIKYLILLLSFIVGITIGFDASIVEAKSKTPEVKVTKVNNASAKKVVKQAKKNKKFILKVKASSKSKAIKMIKKLNTKICDVTTYGAPLDISTSAWNIEKSSKGYYKVIISKEACKTYNLRNTYVEKVYKNIMKEYNNLINYDYTEIYNESYAEAYSPAYSYYNKWYADYYNEYEYVYVHINGNITASSRPMSEEELKDEGLRLLERTAEEYADRCAKEEAEKQIAYEMQEDMELINDLKARGIEKPYKKWSDSFKIELFTGGYIYHGDIGNKNPYFNMDYDDTKKTKGALYYSSEYTILSKLLKGKKLMGVCADFAKVEKVICKALNIKCYYVSNQEDNHAILLMRGDKGSTGRYNYYEGSNSDVSSVDDSIVDGSIAEGVALDCLASHWQKDIKKAMGKDYPKNGCLSGEYNYYFKKGKLIIEN